MSRRHKENDIDKIKPLQVESHEDGSPKRKRFTLGFIGLIDKIIKVDTPDTSLTEKFSAVIIKAFRKKEFEVDDNWVKIPRRYFESEFEFAEASPKSKGGRNPIKSLFKKISDSQLMKHFHNGLHSLKSKCIHLYESVTQYSICFLKAAFNVFAPDDDPYGMISHYHDILKYEVDEFPGRKTLSNWYRWFEDWRPSVTYEDRKAKKNHARHRLWERLIDWIRSYLIEAAPQYAYV
jgi:hypothetical protein